MRDQHIYALVRLSETVPSIEKSIKENLDSFDIDFISGETFCVSSRAKQHSKGKRAIETFIYEDLSIFSVDFPHYDFVDICGYTFFKEANGKKGGNTDFDKKIIFPKCKTYCGWVLVNSKVSKERFKKTIYWNELPKTAKQEFARTENNVEDIKEWFKYIYKILINDINVVKNNILGKSNKITLSLRTSQSTAVNKMVDYFATTQDKKEKREFLLGAIQRFGKNVTWLSAIKQLNELNLLQHKNIFVLSYRPWVFSSLEEDISKFEEFSCFNYIKLGENRKIKTSKNKINIITSSTQLLLCNYEKENDNDVKEYINVESTKIDEQISFIKNTNVETINFDFVIVDEYHFGCTRTHESQETNFKKILKCLQYNNIIWCSGTPYYDLFTGTFSSSQMFLYDQLDEYHDFEEICKTNPYNICKINTYYYNSPALCKLYNEYKDFLDSSELPLIDKLLQSKHGKFINEVLANEFLINIFGHSNPLSANYSIFTNKEFIINDNKDHINTVMCNCGNISRCDAIYNSLSTLKETVGINVIQWYGKYNVEIEDLISTVKYNNRHKIRTIILSCGKGFEGISVPGIHACIHLCSGKSAIMYFQFGYRSKTPDIETKKQYCYIIDFDYNRTLEMYHTISEVCDKKRGSEVKTLSELLDAMPFFASDENGKVYTRIDLVDTFFKQYKKAIESRTYKDYVSDENINSIIESINANKEAYEVALKIVNKDKKEKIQLSSTPELYGGKQNKITKLDDTDISKSDPNNINKEKQDNKEKQELDKLKNQIYKIISFIYNIVITTSTRKKLLYKCETYTDAISLILKDVENGTDYFYDIPKEVIETVVKSFDHKKMIEKFSII